MSDKILEETGRRIIEILKKGNINFDTGYVDKKTDEKIEEIIDEVTKKGGN